MDAPLGSVCQALNKYLENTQGKDRDWFADPAWSLARSAECGCRYCYIACKAIGKDIDVEKNKKDNLNAILHNSGLDDHSAGQNGEKRRNKEEEMHAQLRDSGLNFQKQGLLTEFFVLNAADDPIIPVSASISEYTGSDQSFRIARGWLEDCVKKHSILCPPLIPPAGLPKLPLRVIDIDPTDLHTVRLLETDDEKGLYACLSHCWGGEQPLKTTLDPDTLALHQQGIKCKDLPKTFLEAVIVARKFGIQYLWIDSLCIIQDSFEDWQVQSAQMAEIYQNCVITFAGSASSGPQQGLFREVDPEHLDRGVAGYDLPEELGKIRMRKPLPHTAAELPLLQRGWVFQERLLSPRYLHFGPSELIWECMEQVACECGGLGFEGRRRTKWLDLKSRLHISSLHDSKSRHHEFINAWHAVVVDYSRLKLSHPSDIFPAISGIVRTVKEMTGWEYVAGLWRENIITDLVWRVESPELMRRCQEWRAPTFSWASVMPKDERGSSISYEFTRFFEGRLEDHILPDWATICYAKVVKTDCMPLGDDRMGRLVSGYIILSGTLIRATLRCSSSQDRWEIAPAGGEPLWSNLFWNDYDLHSGDHMRKEGDTVHCLKLIGVLNHENPTTKGYLLYMVLRKVVRGPEELHDINGNCEFERIGMLKDRRDPDMQFEEASDESDIDREVLVKII